MTTAEAKKVVLQEYPKAFEQRSGGTYYVLSGVSLPLMLASGKSAADAWERAAVEVKYANGEID